jgi:N-acetylglucosamine malate deacetylase 1
MVKNEVVFVFGAHTDDFVIGAGGTIANYMKEGKKVISVVFSLGELSHPWMKDHVIKGVREKETLIAGEIMGCETIFLKLRDQKIQEDYDKLNIEKELLKLFEKEKPTKVFTHSLEDPHPDHKTVHRITLGLYDKLTTKIKPEIYVYSVWNPVSFNTKWPALYVNITKTFGKKLEALKTFESQKIHVAYPFLLLLFRAFKEGLKIRTLFGEKFYRIK